MDSIKLIVFCKGGVAIQSMVNNIQQLKVPESHKLEVVFMQGNIMASAYQNAMAQSNAKYKVYIKDSVKILNKNILSDVVKIFSSDRSIGMIGTVGSLKIPTNGVSQVSPRRVGKLDVGGKVINFGAVEGLCREVMAIDDGFMATQYDIPWRADLFQKEGFVAPSQSIEFKRKGYKVAVAAQESPWIHFDGVSVAFDETERNRFLDEYSKDIYPLVSIIIPTYQRPHFFKIALESVINQTYRNLDIFITDNSHNDETSKLMQSYLEKDKRITYEWHDEFKVSGQNWNNARAYDNPKAEYINWLMDDDVFMLNKIEKMVNYFLFDDSLAIVTSVRQRIDADGNILPSLSKFPETVKINGIVAGNIMLKTTDNYIGEPTTVLFRKSFLGGFQGYFGHTTRSYTISDFPLWLNLLTKGDMLYIAEPLSQLRSHPGQQQSNAGTVVSCMIRWALEIQYAWNNKTFLTDEKDMQLALVNFTANSSYAFRLSYDQKYTGASFDVFKDVFAYFLKASSDHYLLNFNVDELLKIHLARHNPPPIYVTRSFLPPMEEYTEEIKDIWQSHWLTNMGVKHKTLQKKLAEYLQVENIELLTNGHMALELSMQALELPKDGEVITTPFTFASTTHAIIRNFLTPVFCDINPDDFTIDVGKIEELITDRTCAIVPVHVYGSICDVEAIEEIARRHNLKVLYDAAHSFGETYKGEGIGTFGDASCFSFHATKVFNSIEGGGVSFRKDDSGFGRRLQYLKNFGFSGPEDVDYVGANAKMNEFCAAMGLCNLKYIEQTINDRKTIVERYRERLDGAKGIRFMTEQKGVKSNYSYFPIVVDEKEFGADRNEVFKALSAQNIYARKYFYPLTSAFNCFHGQFDPTLTPIALQISNRVLTLPLYSELPLDRVDAICDIVLKCRK